MTYARMVDVLAASPAPDGTYRVVRTVHAAQAARLVGEGRAEAVGSRRQLRKRSVCHVVRLTDTLEHHSIRPGTPLLPNSYGTRYSYLGNVTAARPCKACAGVPGLQCRQCGNTGKTQQIVAKTVVFRKIRSEDGWAYRLSVTDCLTQTSPAS